MMRLEPHCMKKHEYDFQHGCPLWVISGHTDQSRVMSALPPIADILSAGGMSALCH